MRRRYQQAALRLARAHRQLRRSSTSTTPPPFYEAALRDCEAALHDLARHGLTPEGPAQAPAERLAHYLSAARESAASSTLASPAAERLTPAEQQELRSSVETLAQWAARRYTGGQS